MASTTTTYDVELIYKVRGDAAPALAAIGTSAEKAAKETDRLRESTSSFGSEMRNLAALVGGGLLFGQGKKAFVDFNKEVENAKINIAAVQRMFGQAPDMRSALDNAAGVFERYQEAAKASTATTKEFLDMHLSLAPTFAKSGVGGKQIEDIVQGATVAAPILGERPEIFAMDIKQMLSGTVTMRDRSATSLLSMLGIDRNEFNQKTKEDVGYAIETVQKALTSPALMEARKVMEESFSGVTSTLMDTVEILAGQAGKPLFAAITAEIKSWNQWLEKNKDTVEEIKQKVSTALVAGFNAVKDAAMFLVEHREALIAIAEVWAGMKAGSLVINEVTSTAKTIGSVIGDGILGKASVIGAAIGAAIGIGVAAKRTQDEWDSIRSRNAEMRGQDVLFKARRDLNQETYNDLATKFIGAGAFNPITGEFDRAKASSLLAGSGEGATAELSGQRISDGMANIYAGMVEEVLQKGRGQFDAQAIRAFSRFGQGPTRLGSFGVLRDDSPILAKNEKKPSVQVTINRVEVASDDPDRFVMGIVDLADKAVGRSGQALSAIPQR